MWSYLQIAIQLGEVQGRYRGGTGEVQGRGPCHVYIRDETCTDASGGVGVVT